jgi:hypothetical protein
MVINVTFRRGIFMLILMASLFVLSFAGSCGVPHCSLLERAIQSPARKLTGVRVGGGGSQAVE